MNVSLFSRTSPVVWALGLIALAAPAAADSVATVPVGYMKFDIPAGSPGAPSSASFGLPLDDETTPAAGIRAGVIQSFSVNTLTNTSGGWTINLANPAAPWLVRLTSGPSSGKFLDIVSNTATAITVSGADLTTLGLTAGTDTFELVPLDTLFSLFGSDALLGGTSVTAADVVQVRVGTTWASYFFDTSLGFWRPASGAATNSNNTPIRPGSGVLITRRGDALTLTFTGKIPATKFRMPIGSSATVLHSGFPTDTTLSGFAAQTLVPGWKNGTSANNADVLSIYTAGLTTRYVFNGTNWLQVSVAGSKDTTPIPAGALLSIQRLNGPAATDLVRAVPYSL